MQKILLLISSIFLLCCSNNNTAQKSNSIVVNKSIDSKEINKTNWYLPPAKNWAFQHMEMIFPTQSIKKGSIPSSSLAVNTIDLDHLEIIGIKGQHWSFQRALDSTYTDALLVYHQGKIKYETYRNKMEVNSYHNWFSMSKSVIGIAVLLLANNGAIDLNANVIDYLPELNETAWEKVTIQMIMDMHVSIDFNEDYNDPTSNLYDFAQAAHFVEIPNKSSPFKNVKSYLKSVKSNGEHGQRFQYNSLNTEILGLLIQRVSKQSPSVFISEHIWSKMGVDQDAYLVQSPEGHEIVSASFNSSLRDLIRFGIMILSYGKEKDNKIIDRAIISDLFKGGENSKLNGSKYAKVFPKLSYHNQWWHFDEYCIVARGLFGQTLYIDAKRDIVIAKFSTHKYPNSATADYFFNDIQLMESIAHNIETKKQSNGLTIN